VVGNGKVFIKNDTKIADPRSINNIESLYNDQKSSQNNHRAYITKSTYM